THTTDTYTLSLPDALPICTVVGWYASRNRALTSRLTDVTRHLEALADRDVLTGLPNLRGFDLAITTRLEGERPFALLVADLDDQIGRAHVELQSLAYLVCR